MPKHKHKLADVLFIVSIVVFMSITLKGMTAPQPGDENVYYYMGKLVSEGKLPYRDFFFAHPPLHIYLIALVYKIAGFNIIALKSIPLISTLTSAFFIFKIAKEKFGYTEAAASSLLFLSSYSIMFNSVFSFGIEIATMFLVIGVYFLWNKNNYILSGIFFGLAGATRLLSLMPVFVILSISLFSNREKFIRLSSAFFIVFLLVNGPFILLAGSDYINQAYKFHLLKGSANNDNIREYADIIKLNWILFSSALLFIFVKDKKSMNMLALISAVYLVFLTALKIIFGFYFIVIFPFLALIGGYSIVSIIKSINLQKRFVIAASVALLSIFAWSLASDIMFLEKTGFTGFGRGKEIVNFVNLNSNKATLLFGDDSVVPLIALLTGKNIAFDFVDTNNQVFISGVRNLNDYLKNLNGKNVLFIIRSRQGISSFADARDFLNRNCGLLSQFHDKTEGDYLIYKCS